jgi:hypothetical protein
MQTGLLARDAGGGGAMPAPAQGEEMPAEDQPNVSPEEQAQYEAFVTTALNLITDDKAEAALLKSLGGSKDPILSLASTALNVVKRVEAAAAAKGTEVPGEIILHGGEEIVSALAKMAEAAQIHAYTPKEIEGAFYRAADMYREEKQAAGQIDQKGAAEDIEELKRAEQAGQLPPQFAEAAAAMGGR